MNPLETESLSSRKKAVFYAVMFSALAIVLSVATKLTLEHLAKPRTLALFQQNPHRTGSYRLKPNLRLKTSVGDTSIEIRTNSHGMRWREVAVDDSQDKVRIAFVGDSFTFGCWAESIQSSFVGVFEQNLSHAEYEVLNFGVGGYGLSDIELLIREEVSRFHPDYVILAFFNGNDFRDTYLGTEKNIIVDGTAKWNNRVLQEKLPPGYRPDFTTSKTQNLQEIPEREGNFFEKIDIGTAFTSYTFWSQTPYPFIAESAVELSLATIDRIEAFVRQTGATLLIAAIPYREQVYVERMRGDHYDAELPQRRVEAHAGKIGVPYLDLLPLLREFVRDEQELIFIPQDPHLNTLGHKVVGNFMAEWFEEVASNSRPDSNQ